MTAGPAGLNLPLAGIQRLPQPVAQQVEGYDDQRQRHPAGNPRHPGPHRKPNAKPGLNGIARPLPPVPPPP